MEWKEWLETFANGMGLDKKVKTVPTFLIKLGMKQAKKEADAKGLEGGLNLNEYVKVSTAKAYIDKSIIRDELGVTDDDIHAAIKESAKLCVDILDNNVEVIDMKGE